MFETVKRLFASAAVLAAIGAQAAGAEDLPRLQKLLDARGEVRFPAGNFTVGKPLVIHSDTRLVVGPDTVIRLADGANSPIIVNEHYLAGVDRNVEISGGVWDGNNVKQDRKAYGYVPASFKYGQLVMLSGVTNLTLRGMTLKDPNGFSVQLTDVEDFLVEDVRFDCNCQTYNQDGIHVNGWARRGVLRRLRGQTNDDLVALNSDEGIFRSADNDISDVLIEDIDGGIDGWTAIRLLSRDAKLSGIRIRDVRGGYKYNVVSFTHWAKDKLKPGMGHFDDIVIEDVTATCARKTGTGHGGLIWFQPGVQDVGSVTIRNLRRVEGAEFLNATHTVDIGDEVKIRELTLENVVQSIPDEKPLVLKSGTASVNVRNPEGRAGRGL